MRRLLTVLAAAAAAAAPQIVTGAADGKCVITTTFVERVAATDPEAAARIAGALERDEPIVVERAAPAALLQKLARAAPWRDGKEPLGVREELVNVAPEPFLLVNGSADARWGCRRGGCRLRDVRGDQRLGTDRICAVSWLLQAEDEAIVRSYERTPAEHGLPLGDVYASTIRQEASLEPGDLFIHPGGWRPYAARARASSRPIILHGRLSTRRRSDLRSDS